MEAFNLNADTLIARLRHAKALAAVEALSKPGSQNKRVREHLSATAVGVEKPGSSFRSDELKEIADQ